MRFISVIIAATLLVAGCERKTDAQKEHIENAERKTKIGEFKPAIREYEAALDGTQKTAEIHYRIALIYDDKLKSYLDAVHHYDRYLDLAPSGTHATDAKNSRKKCSEQFQTKQNNEGFMTQSEAASMRTANEVLRRERTRLEGILDDHKIPYKIVQQPGTNREEQSAKKSLPSGTREYTVKSGDTLASIARAFYKSTALAKNIKDANQFQLKGKDTIRPGQVLIIPEKPAR